MGLSIIRQLDGNFLTFTCRQVICSRKGRAGIHELCRRMDDLKDSNLLCCVGQLSELWQLATT
eukprot:1146389-Pelagomonas_calceolata.AAC.3